MRAGLQDVKLIVASHIHLATKQIVNFGSSPVANVQFSILLTFILLLLQLHACLRQAIPYFCWVPSCEIQPEKKVGLQAQRLRDIKMQCILQKSQPRTVKMGGGIYTPTSVT